MLFDMLNTPNTVFFVTFTSKLVKFSKSMKISNQSHKSAHLLAKNNIFTRKMYFFSSFGLKK